MGSNARLCARCNLTKVTGTRIECRPCGDDTSKHKGFEWQVRKFLEDHEDLKHFTYTDTALPCAAKNASNVRRADFVFVLKDRVVILEVDENEHRYNIPECERKREQQLADSVTEGMYVVIIRYNPMAKGVPWMQNLVKLARVLREAFVTEEVKLANDGIHRVYVGYQMASIRKIDAAYEEVQKAALKRAREDTTAASVEERSVKETQPVQAETTDDSSTEKLSREIEAMKNEMIRKIEAMGNKMNKKIEAMKNGTNNFSLLPENLVKGREKACNAVLARKTGVDQSNDPFFESLKEDVHEKAFIETFLKSTASVNGMHPFDWNKLNESNCFYYIGKNLYDEYKYS